MNTWHLGMIGSLVASLVLPACGGSSRGDFDGPPNARAGAGNAAGQGGSAGAGGAGKGGSASGAGGVGGGGGAAAGGGGKGGAGANGGNAGAGDGGSGDPAGRGGADAGQGGSASGAGGMSGRAGQAGASSAGAAAIEDLEETVDAYCTAAASCCSAMGVPAMLENCRDMYAMNQPAVPSIMSGAITLDAAALARCRAAYAEGPDQCNLNAIVAACQGVFIGQQQVDEPCIGGYDCDRSEDTMTCLFTDSSSMVGVCKRVPHAGLDEPCTFTCSIDSDCSSSTSGSTEALPLCFEDEGLFCEYVGPDSVCHPIVAMGELCTSFDSCGSRGYCEETCKPLSDLGELCGSGCIRKFQCGPEGRCVDPTWATESACTGYAPAP